MFRNGCTRRTPMKAKLAYIVTSVTLAGLLFAGCHSSGGGNGGTGTNGNNNNGGTALSTIVAIGAMAKGSVKVNGVEFQLTTSTTISADDTPKPASFLDDGMTVKVKGSVNADGITGTA